MSKGSVDTTIRFLVFVLIFIIVVFAFVFLFVIPGIKAYKSAKSEYFTNVKYEKVLQKEKKELESQLDDMQKENKKIINLFETKFDKDEFISFAKKYFDNVNLSKINSDTNSTALKIYQFNADIKTQNPRKFYNFIKDLHSYKNLSKINFPITISSNNGHLQIHFRMSIYSMNTK
jgi:lipopolysaccharide export LptBFGC system permease protein LptF